MHPVAPRGAGPRAAAGRGLLPVDRLHLTAVAVLGTLTLTHLSTLGTSAAVLLAIDAAVAVGVLVAARCAGRSIVTGVLHDFSTIAVILTVFWTLGQVIDAVNPTRWDAVLSTADQRWFGMWAEDWRGLFGRPPWLVDVMAVAYVSYYVVPLLVAVPLYRYDRDTFHRMVFTVALTFYVSYVGYLLFPAIGPRSLHAVDGGDGGPLTHALEAFLAVVETTRTDAFPSGHVAVALVCLWFARRASAAVVCVVLPLVAGIAFSTVYLHYHYVVDVVVGAGLAGVCVWLGPNLEVWIDPQRSAGAGAAGHDARNGRRPAAV